MFKWKVCSLIRILADGEIMTNNTVNLSKDSFETHNSRILENLWNYGSFTDITLATNDKKELRVHKAVVSSASKLFKNILNPSFGQTAHVIVNDVEHKYLYMVIRFIYLGWCDVGQEDISEFLATGKALGISNLKVDHDDKPTIKDEVLFIADLYTEDIKPSNEVMSSIREQEKNSFNPLGDAHFEENSNKGESYVKNIKVVRKKDIVGKFLCKVCGSAYLQLGGLNQHIMSKHEGKTYDCKKCDYKGTQPSSLIEHKQVKHTQTKFKCPKCDFQSTWSSGVRKHKLSVHDKLRYGCDQCEHSNTKMEQLLKHKQAYHSGVVHTCNKCDFTTLRPDLLMNHKKIVHQVIPFECDQCDFKSFHIMIFNSHKQFTHGWVSNGC